MSWVFIPVLYVAYVLGYYIYLLGSGFLELSVIPAFLPLSAWLLTFFVLLAMGYDLIWRYVDYHKAKY